MPQTFTTTPDAVPTDFVTSDDTPKSTMTSLATSPGRIRTDEGTVEERKGAELIALDAYTDPNNIAQSQNFGLDYRRVKPGSALGGRPIHIR